MKTSFRLLIAPVFVVVPPLLAQDSEPQDELPPTLDPLVVDATAGSEGGYPAPSSTTGALKAEVPLLETPHAVSVVGEALIEDQEARDLEDILRNVAGVSPGGYYEGWDYYRLRGFDASFATFWDGLRGDYGRSPEVYGLERVEVVKGPASTLYGQAPLGGMVNMVSKRPKREFSGEVGTTVGSWDHYEGRFDVNLPLLQPQGGGLGIFSRITGLYYNTGSFVDHNTIERLYVAPAITFEWGDRTSLTLLTSWSHDWGDFAMALPAAGTVRDSPFGDLPVDRYLALPGRTNQFDFMRARAGYEFRHAFNDVVTLRQNFGYSRLEQTWSDVLYPSLLAADGRTLYLYPYDFDEDMDRVGIDTAADITFHTGKVGHTLTAGLDYYYEQAATTSRQIDYDDFPGSYVPIDIFNPDYNVGLPAYAATGSSDSHQEMFGIYVQDHAKLTDQVTLTLGGRYDEVSYDDGTSRERRDAFSPKAGVTYEFIPGVAAYANYGRSFRPQWFSTDAAGDPVEPEEGENYEVGVKYELLGGRLTGIASVFHLRRENVATADLSTGFPFDSIVSGEQRSQGFELESAAELMPGLTFTAAYTYLDAEVTKDNTRPTGIPLMGVPEHAVSGWLKYTVQEGPLEGFGVGVGGRYYSSQAGDSTNSFQLPSYGLVDAALYYEQESFRAQLNFNNVFDKRHFVGAYNDLYVLPGRPFNVSASVTWKF